jgi:hypothetical protein
MAERSTPAIGKDELAGEMWLTVSMRSGARRGNTTEAVTRERTSFADGEGERSEQRQLTDDNEVVRTGKIHTRAAVFAGTRSA